MIKLNLELTITDDQLAQLANAIGDAVNTRSGVLLNKETITVHEIGGKSHVVDVTPPSTGTGNDTGVPLSTVTPSTTPTADLDSAGLPWDARIHATTKTKTADGQWRRRKGIDDVLVNTVTAELKNVMALPAVAASIVTNAENPTFTAEELAPIAPPPPAPPAAPTMSPVLDNDEQFLCGDKTFTRAQLLTGGWPESSIAALPKPAPVAPTPPAPPAPPAAPAATVATSTPVTFPELLQRITAGIAAGTMTQAQADTAAESVGLSSIVMLAARPDLIPAVMGVLF